MAAGAPAVETARRVMRSLPGWLWPTMVVAQRTARTTRAPRARPRRWRPGRPPRPRRPRPPKDRAPTASGPEPDSPIGRPSTRLSARLNGTSSGTTSAVAGRRSLAEARTPARATRSAAESPARSSSARCVDDSRTAPSPWLRMASNAAKTSGVGTATTGVTSSTPGRPVEPVEGRDLFAAALDQRGAAGQEERHVRAEARRQRVPGVVVELRAPRLERAVERRRGVGRPAGQPGRDRDPLLEPGGQRGGGTGSARPAAADRARGPRRARGARGCRPAGRPRGRSRGACRGRPATGARLSRSARASGTNTEWRAW